jgi:hypothetical protein
MTLVTPETEAAFALFTGDGSSLLDIADAAVVEAIRSKGAVVFRGFEVNSAVFEAFSARFSERFVTNGDPGRKKQPGDEKTTTVTPGMMLLPPHAELAFTPFRPDLLWFHCVVPSRDRGSFLLCDGTALWDALPAGIRAPFETHQLCYRVEARTLDWLRLFLPGVDGSQTAEERLGALPGVAWEWEDDDRFTLEYRCWAAAPTRYDGRPAFANSVVIQPALVRLGGEPLSPSLRVALLKEAMAHTTEVPMQAGDVIVVDNSRVMHGRTQYRDPERQVHVRMGYRAA